LRIIEYEVPIEYDGSRIRNILRHRLGISQAVITELKKYPEGIKLNDKSVFANEIVKYRDIIKISLKDKTSKNIVPSNLKLDILYEDEDILAISKPRSMPVHPSQNHYTDTLANAVMNYFYEKNFTFRVITRLDRDTSGVVLVAKNKIAASILAEQMITGRIEKSYLAICHGHPPDKVGRIDAPISRRRDSAILREVNKDGKKALTEYEVIAENGELSLLKLKLITGRTHQIRVHLSYIGNPIYGDDLYGSPVKTEKMRLHCNRISCYKPITEEKLVFESPIPDDMYDLIKE